MLAEELAGSATSTIDSVISGKISLGDVISGAAQSYLERLFGGNPILRDLDQAARHAAAQAQARRQAPTSSSPRPPGASSSSSSRSAPPPRTPPPKPPPPPRRAPTLVARQILHFDPEEQLTKERINERRRDLAKMFHPDRQGGSTVQMQRVNQAADVLIASLAKRP